MKRLAIVLAVLVYASFTGSASASPSRVDLQALVQELEQLIEQGDAAGVDRRFLDELRGFVDDHDRPWTRTVIDDRFEDGDFSAAPAWSVIEGEFRVDPRYGLVASPTAPPQGTGGGSKDLAAALIGQLLQGRGGAQQEAPAAAASIQTPARASNAFALTVDLSGLGRDTSVEFALAQGQGSVGYALTLTTGTGAGVVLERIGARGRAVVGRYDGVVRSSATGILTLEWTRGRTGRMHVRHDGNTLVKTVDRGLRDGFDRLVISARNAEVGIRRIALNALP